MYPEYNQVIFYAGIAVSAAALIILIVSLTAARMKKIKLDSVLDEEYGKEEKRNGE